MLRGGEVGKTVGGFNPLLPGDSNTAAARNARR